MIPPCEVVKANNTGKPCPNPGTETAELVYPSGVSETKRCCPEHAAMVEKASAAARSVLAARADARRAESDARAERLAALRTARAIRPVAELPPADPVPPVTPVAETPTMPDPTSTPPKPARGKPAPKPERSSLGGVLACRACGKSASYPLCKADRERVRKLRLLKLLPADFDAKTSPISILDEAWAAFRARESQADALPAAAAGSGETKDPAIVPPKVGDHWDDLTDEQQATAGPWTEIGPDRRITRLGFVPTATPEAEAPDPRDAEIAGLRATIASQSRDAESLRDLVSRQEAEQAEFRSKVRAAIEARLPTATDDPLLARIVDVAVDYTSATATVQQVVDALRGNERPDGYTSSIAKSVADLLVERDEAVKSIAALRADADELRALREALVSGKGRGIGKASLDALNAAEDRMLEAVREQTRANDDRTVAVLRFATERILDSIATASKDGRPADLGLLEAVRVIATGKVP